eukprot:CAMPEP_0177160472 /NCGR_PEP_ID=MMETSP0367-20130122/4845_1 /TAXON_ID=447022 ORGANISM="Scrippsiella hangoei-like, Strain SHHI-4" /NCGR_SAMPLE_ID=MMETSP0367 /ASSEMBLY_ACC=CAM_ASM_000362 /LENGTH=79 /DNA_ID=CAMNT_0018606129 /DNA_START=54 /DNA_END=289 /DNA_ORIENTATION=+
MMQPAMGARQVELEQLRFGKVPASVAFLVWWVLGCLALRVGMLMRATPHDSRHHSSILPHAAAERGNNSFQNAVRGVLS